MTLDEMLIRSAIQYTIGRYCSAIDRGCYEELTEVFTPDAVATFCNAPALVGPHGMISTMTRAAEARGSNLPQNFQRHLLGNSIINVLDSQNAKAVHYIIVISELGPDHSGVYIDDFVKYGDRWLIARRQANVEWARPDSRFAAAHGGPVGTARPQLNVGFAGPIGG